MTTDTQIGRKETPTSHLVLSVDAPRAEWLAARRNGITATDIVAIAGMSNYRTALDIWTDKVMEPGEDTEAGEAAFWGTRLEEPVAQAWAEKHNVKVRRVGLVHNEEHPWAMASLDRLVVGCQDGRCALEIKTRSLFVSEAWERAVPADVMAQVQWQLMVSGLDHIHVAALIGGQRMVEHTVQPDTDTQAMLLEAGQIVWNAVQTATMPDLPPEMWSNAYLDQRHPERTGATEISIETHATLNAYTQTVARIAELEARKDELRVQLIGALGDAEAATLNGKTAYTYKATTSRRINSKALVDLHPDTANDERIWNTSTTRALRITTKGDTK